MLFRCQRCQVQISVPETCKDYEHQCNSGIEALDNEDVKIMGTWTDYTGSSAGDLRFSQPNVTWQNLGNKLMGMEGWVRDNAKNFDRTTRGNNKQTYRTRQHLEYITDVKLSSNINTAP